MKHAGEILKAISIFEKNELEPILLVDKIKLEATEGNANLAKALYYFIPMAYCRELLQKDLNFPDYYFNENPQGKLQEKSLTENPLFLEVQRVAEALFIDGKSQPQVLAVLAHSAEFDAINQALNNGVKLEDLELAPCILE